MKHIHAELMAQYALDAMETDRPWEKAIDNLRWRTSKKYRRKYRDLSKCKNPLSQSDKPLPIQSVLRILASQEGCDGAPWDQMMQAADYIERLAKPSEIICTKCGLREQRGEKPSANF
jgi:hypothetical protein